MEGKTWQKKTTIEIREKKLSRPQRRKHRGAASRRFQNRIAQEMQPDGSRQLALPEIALDGFPHVLLQLAEVFALCGDAAASGCIPRSDKPAAFLVPFHCQRDFSHQHIANV